MKPLAAFVSAMLVLGTAAVAHAEQMRPLDMPQATFTARDAFAPDPNQWGPQVGRRSLQWDSKTAHWGVKLDLDSPVGRPLSYTDADVRAGAYYKITPSFRVGGAVSLGQVNEDPHAMLPPDKAPKVRLETAFKF
jgi:hypothetical protein